MSHPRPDDNALRHQPESGAGHVESYFLRANHPDEPRAVWLKATVLAPKGTSQGTAGEATSRVWAILFDGTTDTVWAGQQTVPLAEAHFEAGGDGRVDIEAAGCSFTLGPNGTAAGSLTTDAGSGAWDLRWEAAPAPFGAPLTLLPHRVMLDAPFPKSKTLTPFPVLRFSGELRLGKQTVEVRDWVGMQGHNWGREHAWQYAWGQCVFPDAQGEPHCVVEGFTARIKLAGWVTPPLSMLLVRRGGRTYRFNRLIDLPRHTAEVGDVSWSVRLRGPDGEAQLVMEARPEWTVCLGYANPDGRQSYCFNSKLAQTTLRVNPFNEDAFECTSPHGGALELLTSTPDPRFPVV